MTAGLGIDVGGTFTDLLLLDEDNGEIRLLKTPSTPADQSIGIIDDTTTLLDRANVRPGDIRTVLHGTTVSTNIVLEEKGAEVGLLVTENFEQVLHLARSQTPGPARRSISCSTPRVVESITVSLMHSYANDAHEQRLKALVLETGADVPVSLSSEILPEFRKYERTLVTVMNACVRPRMRRYLQNLDDKLRTVDLNASLHIVRSDGCAIANVPMTGALQVAPKVGGLRATRFRFCHTPLCKSLVRLCIAYTGRYILLITVLHS